MYFVTGILIMFKFLLKYKLSQDHIEMFFSAARSQGGFNNNPSAKQFMTTYRHLLIHHSLKNIKTGNSLAQDATQILSVAGGIVNHQECKFNDDDPTVFIANDDITQFVICTIVEKFLRYSIPDISKTKELQLFTKSIPYLKLNIRRQLISKVIFQGLINHIQELPFEDNHLVKLINLIIDAYLDVHLYHVSSCATSCIQGVRVRNKLTKLVLFKNQ